MQMKSRPIGAASHSVEQKDQAAASTSSVSIFLMVSE